MVHHSDGVEDERTHDDAGSQQRRSDQHHDKRWVGEKADRTVHRRKNGPNGQQVADHLLDSGESVLGSAELPGMVPDLDLSDPDTGDR